MKPNLIFGALAGIVALLTMAWHLFAGSDAYAATPAPQQPVTVQTKFNHTVVATVEHDGHRFVVLSMNAILHHPDCRCQAR
ncbi:MAG TPA: hypothetical protein VHF69_03345 [Candidatus Synoicihabitans sp.]|nr:hypothetical protein [Candidatus Synoicihabitans sp.]